MVDGGLRGERLALITVGNINTFPYEHYFVLGRSGYLKVSFAENTIGWDRMVSFMTAPTRALKNYNGELWLKWGVGVRYFYGEGCILHCNIWSCMHHLWAEASYSIFYDVFICVPWLYYLHIMWWFRATAFLERSNNTRCNWNIMFIANDIRYELKPITCTRSSWSIVFLLPYFCLH